MKRGNVKLLTRIVLAVLAAALLIGAAACDKRQIQSGEVDQDLTVEDLDRAGPAGGQVVHFRV